MDGGVLQYGNCPCISSENTQVAVAWKMLSPAPLWLLMWCFACCLVSAGYVVKAQSETGAGGNVGCVHVLYRLFIWTSVLGPGAELRGLQR